MLSKEERAKLKIDALTLNSKLAIELCHKYIPAILDEWDEMESDRDKALSECVYLDLRDMYWKCEADRDHWKKRAEAFERAVSGFCTMCKRAEKAFPDLPNSSIVTCDSIKKRNLAGVSGRGGGKDCHDFEFDEAKFSEGGESE